MVGLQQMLEMLNHATTLAIFVLQLLTLSAQLDVILNIAQKDDVVSLPCNNGLR